ncbi:J domain-containing protein [Arthrobacter oryzae]|jgi:DnaJ family protein C protein 7|uniref:J domain-containing protein n=1 Tax=Arthrobacter oryzae TaxID=409290 RepID=UPI002784B55C|nr:DnaJ domain-containing protein [Arthrobacter oryzae]MDQ0079178.1 DnaJ family protein C protein 7 [Arthrobacter oryzae]
MSNQPRDYYEVLKVDRTATRQEIARAYRALMRIHHPDVDDGGSGTAGPGNGGLLEIMEAFAVLGDPGVRAEYDKRLSAPTTGLGAPQEVPVRRVRAQQPPLLRVTPVLWERGPRAGAG